MNYPIKILLPWNTSNFMFLNGFNQKYKFIMENQFKNIHSSFRYLTFNEKLFLEFMFTSSKGSALREYLNDFSRRLEAKRDILAEFRETWDFFDVNETLIGEISEADLQIIHTTPLFIGIKPFIYHLESFETLFYPWTIYDPFLTSTPDSKIQSIIEYLKSLLENPLCLSIVSHLPSTLEKFKKIFNSEIIQKKLEHCPLGFPIMNRISKSKNSFRFIYNPSFQKITNCKEKIEILIVLQFINVWLEKFPEDEFILFIPALEDLDFPELCISKILPNSQVYNFGNQHLSETEINHILNSSDFILIPSLQPRSESILKSMGAGVIPVVLDLSIVRELGLNNKNSIIINIKSDIRLVESSLFGSFYYIKECNVNYIKYVEETTNQLEMLKKAPRIKDELSLNSQMLIRNNFEILSSAKHFSNIILENINNKYDLFSSSLTSSTENLVPLRFVYPEDFETKSIYNNYLNFGFSKILSNGMQFFIEDKKIKIRKIPSFLSNNNGKESFIGKYELNLMEITNQGKQINKLPDSIKYAAIFYLNKFPRLKKFLKKIGINKFLTKIRLF